MTRHNRITGAAGETEHGKATNSLQPRGIFIPADDPHGQVGAWREAPDGPLRRLARRVTRKAA